ncbi:hypothetical protein C173_20331 [Paenibacillus sp. FSL R7-277]|nr:hypothetical protein C173_20331 [Paenibacillus sp. FSL R7-277]
MVNFLMCAKEVWNKCPLYVLWQHKKVMLMRLEYLEPKRIVTNSYISDYLEIERDSHLVSKLYIKYIFTKNESLKIK